MKKTKPISDLSCEYLQTEFSERAAGTVANHTYYLEQFLKFIGKRKIDPFSYQDWTRYAFKRWAPQTARGLALAASNRFLNWMERCGHIDRSPHRVTKAPIVKTPPPREPFTEEEVNRLKALASNPSMLWAIVCGWETGMAIGDVSLLCWADVDFTENIVGIYRQKTHERCLIPFRPGGECEAMLQQKFTCQSVCWPNRPEENIIYVDTELAILYRRGQGYIQNAFSEIREKAGIDSSKSFHNLRASFCSRLANAGIQTALACQMTGHKNPGIFAHYVTPDVVRLHEQSNLAWEKQA